MCNPYVKVLYIYQLDDVYLPVEENSGKQSIYSYYETLTKNVPNKKRELLRKVYLILWSICVCKNDLITLCIHLNCLQCPGNHCIVCSRT
jgi:hypothetical protein